MDKTKLKISWNTDSNGVVFPETYTIDENDIEWFKEIPDDQIVAISEQHEGSVQYNYTYKKAGIDSVTVTGRRRLRGKDKIGTLERNENGEFEYIGKDENRDYRSKDRKRISDYLGVPYEEVKLDDINSDMFLYDGHPIKIDTKIDEDDKFKTVYSTEKGNPFYERLLGRINFMGSYCKIGDFLVCSNNSNWYLAGSYDSKEEKQEDFDRLLEYLDYDVEAAEKYYNILNREKTKFEIPFSREYKKNKDIVEYFSNEKDGLDKIISMAANGSKSARYFLESRTLIEEKDDLEKLIKERYYENEFSEDRLKEKLSEDFEGTLESIYYDLMAYDRQDFFEIDQETGEDVSIDKEARATVIKRISEDPKMISILLEEAKKRGIDISDVVKGKEFEYVGLLYSYPKDSEIKFINDKLPSLATHTGEMETVKVDDTTTLHREKVDYTKQNERFINELMNDENVKLVYLSRTSNDLIGTGYYDTLVAVSDPDRNGVSRVLSEIPIPVLRQLGVDVDGILNGEVYKGKFVGVADGIGYYDHIEPLNDTDEVTNNIANIRYSMHDLSEIPEVMMENGTNLDDINSVLGEFTKEVKENDKDETKKGQGIDD